MPNADMQQRTRRRRQRQYARDRWAARWHGDVFVGGQIIDEEKPDCSAGERRILGKSLLYWTIVARDALSACENVAEPLSPASLAALARIHTDARAEPSEP